MDDVVGLVDEDSGGNGGEGAVGCEDGFDEVGGGRAGGVDDVTAVFSGNGFGIEEVKVAHGIGVDSVGIDAAAEVFFRVVDDGFGNFEDEDRVGEGGGANEN